MSKNLGFNDISFSHRNFGQTGDSKDLKTNQQYNVNLHPSFFQVDLPIQPEARTVDSMFFKRSQAVREILSDTNTKVNQYELYKEDYQTNSYAKDVLKGMFTNELVYSVYFSDKNILNILKALKYTIYKLSGHKIDIEAQQKAELVGAMRAMLITYPATNPYSCKPDDIEKQINQWNGLVITELTPHIISNIEQYYGYLKDAGTQPIPLRHPQNLSTAGTKTLRSTTDVLFGDDFFNKNSQQGLFDNQQPNIIQQEGQSLLNDHYRT